MGKMKKCDFYFLHLHNNNIGIFGWGFIAKNPEKKLINHAETSIFFFWYTLKTMVLTENKYFRYNTK